MKRIKLLLLVCGACLALSSCTPSNKVAGDCRSYMMPKENALYEFDGVGTYSDWTVFYTYVSEESVTRSIEVDGMTLAETMVLTPDKARITHTLSPHPLMYDMTKDSPLMDSLVLSGPLEVGNTWVHFESELVKSVSEVTAIDKEVVLPYGTLSCLEITSTQEVIKEGTTITIVECFAVGFGLVKSEQIEDGEVIRSSSLRSVNENVGADVILSVFTDVVDPQVLIEEQHSLHTNEDMVALWTETLRTNGLLKADESVQSLRMDYSSGIITVDVSGTFFDRVSADADMEWGELHRVINTFCWNYQTQYMVLTIDGAPYQSGQVIRQAGDVFAISAVLLAE